VTGLAKALRAGDAEAEAQYREDNAERWAAAAGCSRGEQAGIHWLRAIRNARRASQFDVAAAMRRSQACVSRIERGGIARVQVATLGAYVRALGGTLRVTAHFGDRVIDLSGDHAEGPVSAPQSRTASQG
jgi:hypothetical protein